MEKGLFNQPMYTKTKNEVKHNVKVSFYPDGRDKMLVVTKPIFLEKGYEAVNSDSISGNIQSQRYEYLIERSRKIQAQIRWQEILLTANDDSGAVITLECLENELSEINKEINSYIKSKSKPKNMENETRGDNIRRAKQKVFDISRLNRFKWFITWTLDKNEIDRYDKKEVSKRLKKFLDNKVQRNAATYLIIPEYHKDGAIHMHGLISGNFKMVDSGVKTKGGQAIYNMPDWKFGYSTAIELDDNVGAISRYITKYISKDFKKIFGSFYYAGGRGLMREPPIALYDIDYSEVKTEKEYIKFGTGYKFVELGDCTDEEKADIMERIIEYDAKNA